MGLNWDAIRREYEQKASPEELRVRTEEEVRPKSARKSRATGSRNYKPGKQCTWDVEEALQLWLSGETLQAVADKVGKHETTVREQFNKDSRYDPNRDRGGSRSREVCKRGHRYAEVGYYGGGAGKSCKLCHSLSKYFKGLEEARDAVAEVLTGEAKQKAIAAIEDLIYTHYGDGANKDTI